jgi:protein-tyrosine-phosphatase
VFTVRDALVPRRSLPQDGAAPAPGLPARICSYIARQLESAGERRRMTRIRRRPAALHVLLRSARTVLIVCHGNIIRSPFAARLMAQMLSARGSIRVLSAGMAARPGRPPDPGAVVAASRLGVDLRDHKASAMTAEMVSGADVIFVMDMFQLVAMRKRFPPARGRTFLMAALCRDLPLEIRDPFGADAAAIQECYTCIVRTVSAIVRVIAGEG